MVFFLVGGAVKLLSKWFVFLTCFLFVFEDEFILNGAKLTVNAL